MIMKFIKESIYFKSIYGELLQIKVVTYRTSKQLSNHPKNY